MSGKIAELLAFLGVCVGIHLRQPAVLAFGLCLVIPVVVGVLGARRRLRGVSVRLVRPARVRAHTPFPVRIEVSSPRGIRDLQVRFPWAPSAGINVLFGEVRAGVPAEAEVDEVMLRRGPLRPRPLLVTTASPLGLAHAEERIPGPDGGLVLPALGRVRGVLRDDALARAAGQRAASPRRGDGVEIWGVRPFVPGDSTRRIHWRTSARTGVLVVREHEAEAAGTLLLGLGWPAAAPVPARLVEAAISLVATLVHTRTRSGGSSLLLLPRAEPLAIAAGDRVALAAADERLARLDQEGGWPEWPHRLPAAVAGMVLVHPGPTPPPRLAPGVVPRDAGEAIRTGAFLQKGAGRP